MTEYYQVADICAHKVEDGHISYKIHWHKYKECTWEPLENLNNVAQAALSWQEKYIKECDICRGKDMKIVAHVCWEFNEYSDVEGIYGK